LLDLENNLEKISTPKISLSPTETIIQEVFIYCTLNNRQFESAAIESKELRYYCCTRSNLKKQCRTTRIAHNVIYFDMIKQNV